MDPIMDADKNFKFPSGFVVDPGEDGKKTIAGIDSDNDGFRDDLKRWIYARFPDNPKKRAALKQMALNYQEGLLLETPKNIRKHDLRSSKAHACMHEVFGEKSSIEHEFLQAKILNTKIRTRKYLEVDRWFDGMMLGDYKDENGPACEN
jgi:hypothetical protein